MLYPSQVVYAVNTVQSNNTSLSCRFCAAARAALHTAVPWHPGFLELALQHQYPLRCLDTVELPYCGLGSYLAKVQCAGMTCLAADGSDLMIGCRCGERVQHLLTIAC